jgi:hypothetical protein
VKPRTVVPLTVVLTLVGCQEPLKEAQRIEEPRVLGVRIATASDRASLERGESAELRVLLAGPEGPLQARLAYELCEAADSAHGVPFCAADVLAQGTGDVDGAPIPFDVPATTPEGAHLALLGVACPEGEPKLDENPSDSGCSGGAEALRWSFDAWIASADFANQNPDLSELRVAIGDSIIPLDALDAPPSCDADAPEVAADVTHELEIALGAGARESGESLQLSHFSTSGLFERQYSFIDPDEALETSVEWRAPSAGNAAKQYLVLRDGRGGVSFASFSLCAR